MKAELGGGDCSTPFFSFLGVMQSRGLDPVNFRVALGLWG